MPMMEATVGNTRTRSFPCSRDHMSPRVWREYVKGINWQRAGIAHPWGRSVSR